MTALYVFLGGGLGSVLRWGIGQWLDPWGTLAVNLIGSAILAFIAHPAIGLAGPWKTALCVGLMGGFTTYSTFNLEVLTALHDGEHGKALLLIVLTVVGALVAGSLGWWLAAQVSA